MRDSVAGAEGEGCTFRDSDFRYDARAHWTWLRAELRAGDVLYRQRAEGCASRLAGLPWRELAAHELESLAGDGARAAKYAGRARRRIESLLPPRLRPLVPLLILDERGTIEVQVGGSRALPTEQVEDLQELCRRRHRRAAALTSNERKRLARRLAYINPVNVTVYAAPSSDMSGTVIEHAAFNATAAAAGSWVVVASAAGFLPVGRAEPLDDGRVAVEPKFTFTREL